MKNFFSKIWRNLHFDITQQFFYFLPSVVIMAGRNGKTRSGWNMYPVSVCWLRFGVSITFTW